MKNKTKTNYLLGILLSVFMIVGIINITNGATKTVIDTNPDSSKLHTPSLFSLFLGSDSNNYAQIGVGTGGSGLDILNGLIVGKDHTVTGSPKLSVIGGGYKNEMGGNNAGIGGGKENKIHFDNGVIGGGYRNRIEGENGIIGGGWNNQASNYGIVLGGQDNIAVGTFSPIFTYYAIILGGKGNTAKQSSLVLGSNAYGVGPYSFAWNGYATGESARIDATGGMLIGTYNPITGVSLVVSGAIKLGKQNYHLDLDEDGKILLNDAQLFNIHLTDCTLDYNHSDICKKLDLNGDGKVEVSDGQYLLGSNGSLNPDNLRTIPFSSGGIAVDGKGCIQFYDGNTYNTLGKVSEDSGKCGINTGCQFGVATLHNGDIVTAYSVSYTGDCQNASGKAICENGQMVDLENHQSHVFVYPYCYNLSDDPIITVTEGYQQCHEGLPEHAVWTNGYFTQRLQGDTYTTQPEAKYDEEGTKECSFKCIGGYEYINYSCVPKCTGGEEPASNDTNIVTSTVSPSEPTQWTYVEGSLTAACQWTCTGDYVRASTATGDPLNYCTRSVQPNRCPSQENISFPDGLCEQGEIRSLVIGIPDNSTNNNLVGSWFCSDGYHSNHCTGYYLPTAVFTQEQTDNGLKVYIDKYKNGGKVSWNSDTKNFQGVILPVIKLDSVTCLGTQCHPADITPFSSTELDNHIALPIAETGNVQYPTTIQNYTFNGRNLLGYAGLKSTAYSFINTNMYPYKNPDIKYGNTCRSTNRSFNSFVPGNKYIFIKNEVCDGTGNFRAKDGYILLYGGLSGSNVNEPEEPELVAYLLPGSTVEQRIIAAKHPSIYQHVMTKFIQGTKEAFEQASNTQIISDPDRSDTPVYIRSDNNQVIYYYSEASKIYMNEDSSYMFNEFDDVTEIDLSRFDTSKVTKMNHMFNGCTSLTNLNISNFNTSKVTDMQYMFYNCTNLTNLNLSHFNTSKVTNMRHMFGRCLKLTNLNISSFNTSKVTNMNGMFSQCKSLTNLNLSHFNTSEVTNMKSMFSLCENLTNLNISSFNTSKVTDMENMFERSIKLTTLDLSSFDTSNVTNMKSMFGIYNDNYTDHEYEESLDACKNLKTIYVSDNFKTTKVPDNNILFFNCKKLTGGQGTTYSGSHIDKEYARIDCGPSKPGYFSRKDGDYSSCGGTTYSCQGTLPEHATLRNSTTPTNNSTKYEHSSTSTNIACKFHCDDKYRWDSSNKKCKETCTVTFVANGGTFSDKDRDNSSNPESDNQVIKVVYDCGHQIIPNNGERIPTPFKFYECFKGRYTSPTQGTFLGNGSIINSDITVYAQYGTGIGSFQLNPNGGTVEYYNKYSNHSTYYNGNNFITVQDVCNDKIAFGYLKGPNGEDIYNWKTTCRDVRSSVGREIYTISSPYLPCTIRAIWNPYN